jgi:hypothetical protein
MANPTTNYAFAMPTNTDLVKDLPADFEIFGQAVDTQMKTNADAAIAKSIVDAKGDIIAATAADTVSRLAVGANDTVLTADSSTATGLKWAASASFLPFVTQRLSSYYVKNATGTFTDITIAEDRTYYTPFFVTANTFDRISCRTASSYLAATSVVRLGVYNMDTTTGKPSTVAFDAGTVTITSAGGANYEITINQTLASGYYFFAFNCQTAPAFPDFRGKTINDGFIFPTTPIGTAFNDNTTTAIFYEDGVTGAFATAGSVTATSSTPIMGMRIA